MSTTVHSTAKEVEEVTKSDTVNFAFGAAHRLYVGTGGTLTVVMPNGDTAQYNPANNTYLEVGAVRVNATDSTAVAIIAERW